MFAYYHVKMILKLMVKFVTDLVEIVYFFTIINKLPFK